MCGYARRHIGYKELMEFLNSIDMMGVFKDQPEEPIMQHFYPAFGGASSRQIKQLIIRENDELKTVDATWWFDCEERDGQLIVNNARTTFNARNLASAYWKGAIRHHRGVVLATALGEGKEVDGRNRHYFMQGETPILLGAVYRPFPNNLYSTAIITRDAHPNFGAYHDKAFPLFLPADPEFLKLWLSNEPESHPEIAALLENPKVYSWMDVTPVKTFKDAVATGETEILLPDTAFAAKDLIVAALLKWLPLGEHLVNSLNKNQLLVVIRWRPISSDTVITDIFLDKKLVKKVQYAVEADNTDLIASYMARIEDFIVLRAGSYEDFGKQVWHFGAEILDDDVLDVG